MSERWRYETVDGRLHSIVRVTEPWRKRWWQFWRKPLRDREYLVEPFTGKMTPL